jgi:serine/threonine protein kinase
MEYLHNRQLPILHRDIKPENLLICQDHHCKLADFGAANFLDGQRLSYSGTEEYMAPEVLEHRPHGMPYDIWCLGILSYELLTGEVPKIGQPYPDFLSRAAEDFVKKLLVVDQLKRMTLG